MSNAEQRYDDVKKWRDELVGFVEMVELYLLDLNGTQQWLIADFEFRNV